MILICYDGSPDSQSAIDQSGELFKADAATILTVWVPYIDVMARTGSGLALAPGMINFDQIDEASEQNARARASEGAERAKRVGLTAQPRTRAQRTTVADAIIVEAADVGASAIAIGTRGLTGLKSIVLGSVSHAVLHRAELPVLVVPGPQVPAGHETQRH